MAIAQDHGAATDTDEWTKPAFLRRVRIEGYKSIAFCDVRLQPLTILLGRNASGKSNFLDALAFLRDVLERGLDEAVSLHGGRKAILSRVTPLSTVSFRVETSFQSLVVGSQQEVTSIAHFADYLVTFELPDKSKPVVLSEEVRIKNDRNETIIRFNRTTTHVDWGGFPDDKSSPIPITWNPDRLLLAIYGNMGPLLDLSLGLRETGFYNFSPDKIRKHQSLTFGTRLERDGRNLASVIESVDEIDPETIRRVSSYLSAIVSEVEGFRVVHYGNFGTLQFRLHSNDREGKPIEFDASSMSDGTLRALAALVAAFQIQLPFGLSVVGIEEPETSLHPAAMRALVDAMEEATGRTQILLTTHSADLLTDRDLHSSQVLVLRNRDGQTLITPVDSASREIIEKELDTLADLHRQDHLDLDEADLQRQAAERAREGGA